MTSIARLLIIIIVCGLVSCARPGIHVTRAEFGDAWPFTIDAGTDRGVEYGVNGSARDFGFRDVKTILRPGAMGVHLQPFIDRGLMLCRR